MSYRASSYRKLKKAMAAGRDLPEKFDMATFRRLYGRHHGNRISHWLNARPLDKSIAWGKPKGWRL